jgi:hypothetical protein
MSQAFHAAAATSDAMRKKLPRSPVQLLDGRHPTILHWSYP